MTREVCPLNMSLMLNKAIMMMHGTITVIPGENVVNPKSLLLKTGMSELASNWARLARNQTNLEMFKILFQIPEPKRIEN